MRLFLLGFMKNSHLHETFLQAARKLPEDSRVPYSFEKRVMARVMDGLPTTNPPDALPDALALWSRGLWRSTLPCLALMLAIGMWSLFANERLSTDPLASDIELTMMQPFNELEVENLW